MKICFVCLKGASNGDIAFKHTEHAFWWEIMMELFYKVNGIYGVDHSTY